MQRIKNGFSKIVDDLGQRLFGDSISAARTLLIIGVNILILGYLYTYVFQYLLPDGTPLPLWQFVADLYANGGAELLSIAITVLIIDRLNQRRAVAERKEELILQMGSRDNAFAVEAVRLLKHKGWLEDGSLKHAHLEKANLTGAHLGRADLVRAFLINTNLAGANLGGANLAGAYLINANLEGAYLHGTNLAGANLIAADLAEARFYEANLEGAVFVRSIRSDAPEWYLIVMNVDQAKFDEKSILPNGKHWFEGAVWPDDFLPQDQLALLKQADGADESKSL